MPFQFRKEAIEEDLNSNFPSQGQGNPPLYYSLSEVVVPTYSINNVAEGTSLPENLQTAWDFSTGFKSVRSGTQTIANTPGFYSVSLTCQISDPVANELIRVDLSDGFTTKPVWFLENSVGGSQLGLSAVSGSFVCYLRSGDTLTIQSSGADALASVWYRQIADVNGNLVNPLGFSFA